MYQRLSAHISSVDIPDIAADLRETARETASKVESALARGTSQSGETCSSTTADSSHCPVAEPPGENPKT